MNAAQSNRTAAVLTTLAIAAACTKQLLTPLRPYTHPNHSLTHSLPHSATQLPRLTTPPLAQPHLPLPPVLTALPSRPVHCTLLSSLLTRRCSPYRTCSHRRTAPVPRSRSRRSPPTMMSTSSQRRTCSRHRSWKCQHSRSRQPTSCWSDQRTMRSTDTTGRNRTHRQTHSHTCLNRHGTPRQQQHDASAHARAAAATAADSSVVAVL